MLYSALSTAFSVRELVVEPASVGAGQVCAACSITYWTVAGVSWG